jgi:hypothetical protein
MKSMKVKYKMKNMMTQELTIPLNFDRLKRWRWKCLRFDSSQSRLWFECDYLRVSIFLQRFCCQNWNWSRKPHPRRNTILRVQNQNVLNWTILHNYPSHITDLHSIVCGCASCDLHSQTDSRQRNTVAWIQRDWIELKGKSCPVLWNLKHLLGEIPFVTSGKWITDCVMFSHACLLSSVWIKEMNHRFERQRLHCKTGSIVTLVNFSVNWIDPTNPGEKRIAGAENPRLPEESWPRSHWWGQFQWL